MSENMHVICLQETGHILGALSAATSNAPPDLEAIVGSQLSISNVRSSEIPTDKLLPARTHIPASLLELKSVPLDPAVISNPTNHAVDGGRVVKLPPLTAVPITPTLEYQAITLENGTIDALAFTVVARTGDPTDQLRIQSGTFVDQDGDGSVDKLILPLSILPGETPAAIEDSGSYDIFVALQGVRPYWAMQPLP
ncbi:MAG: hypothetical protein AB2809_18020 [Candidatus Thiodiazotropha sp.]